MDEQTKSGYLVKTKSGKVGRTIHEKGLINGKVPVYLATQFQTVEDTQIPIAFSKDAIL